MADVWDIAEAAIGGKKLDVWDVAEAAVAGKKPSNVIYESPKINASPDEIKRMQREFILSQGGFKDVAKQRIRDAVPYVRPAAEGVGAALGGIVGLPLAPETLGLSSIAGAGLGYGMAKNVMDTLEGKWAVTPQEAATRAVTDVGTGMMYEMGGQAVVPAVSGTAKAISSVVKPVLGKMSGTGKTAIEQAILSGEKSYKGNPLASKTEFDKALRGDTSADDIVTNVQDALHSVKAKRAADYQAKMATVTSNQRPIDMTPFKMDLTDLMDTYKVKIDPATGKVDTSRIPMGKKGRNDIEDIIDTVSSWGSQAGDDTAIGLDTLKRQLDDFYSESSQARQFVTEIKNRVKDAIVKEVPEYAEMTKNYSDATKMIKDFESGLMLRKNGMTGRVTEGQTLNRLSSAMRDNNELRADLLQVLGDQGGQDLIGQVAGYSMNPIAPKGLSGVIGASAPAIATAFNPAYAAAFAASSPRAQAEFLRLIGKLKGASNAVPNQFKSNINRQLLMSGNGLLSD